MTCPQKNKVKYTLTELLYNVEIPPVPKEEGIHILCMDFSGLLDLDSDEIRDVLINSTAWRDWQQYGYDLVCHNLHFDDNFNILSEGEVKITISDYGEAVARMKNFVETGQYVPWNEEHAKHQDPEHAATCPICKAAANEKSKQ